MTNFRSITFIRNNGSPRMVTNGPPNITASSNQLTQVRARKNRPVTFRGNSHLRRPSWSAVDR